MVGHVMRKSGSDILIVLMAASGREEATRIAQALVSEKLAACANVVPAVTSIFHWKGRVQKNREALLIVKTTGRRYPALEKTMQAMHSYELPEIVAVRVDRGLDQYLEWVRKETASN
jgi:periplasmic divalent cation tolerance protein